VPRAGAHATVQTRLPPAPAPFGKNVTVSDVAGAVLAAMPAPQATSAAATETKSRARMR
jgi:hypothetical protein